MSDKDLEENIGANLEAQLNDLLGVPVTSMDDKIDAAVSKIVNDSTGNIPVNNSASVSGKTKKDKKNKNQNKQKKQEQPKTQKQPKPQKTYNANFDEEPEKKGKAGKIIGIIAGVLVLAAVGVYVGFAFQYRNVFFDGTIINGVDCSKLSVAQAEDIVKKQVENYAVQLDFKDDEVETIDGTDIDYAYVSDGSIAKIKDSQNMLLWIKGKFKTEDYEVAEGVTYDENLLKSKLESMTHMQADNQTAPEDAYVEFVDNEFQIIPEKAGTQINEDTLLEQLKTAVSASQTELNVADTGAYVEPSVLSDNSELATDCEQLNTYAKVSVTYDLPTGTQVLDGNTVKDWLVQDADGNYNLNANVLSEKVTEYVAAMAEAVDSVGSDRTFKATLQGEITVSGGTYGWTLDQKTEVEQLKANIINNEIVTREPAYTTREEAKKDDNSGFGSTYIEIDLTNQHLWYYVDGAVYVESDFVSGTATKADRKTPGGIFRIYYKQRDKTLTGQLTADGVPSYQSPVKYWMPFNGGIGMHDASWRDNFGGTIYKYSGSHGCINLPTKKAAAIYEKIDKTVPIICFY